MPKNVSKKSNGDDAQIKARRKTALAAIRRLKKRFPNAECALDHESAFQLLVATILSAQCTDERVNQATPELFRKYPDPLALKQSRQKDVEKIVHPLGFFRAKATNIRNMAAMLVDNHGSEIPQEIDELIKLPGVGRKTASVVLGTWYGCLLYTSPSPRDRQKSRMPSSA